MSPFFWPFSRCSAIVQSYAPIAVLALCLIGSARADDLQDATRLLRQGQHAQALERVNKYLASRPRDAQGRFLRGLILTEQNKSAEAIEVFTRLTKDYPELPEPYNNLAVLYAAQGQYEKARQALEQSIRTHPSYATAYENLGDVYTKLATQAYDKALQLDSSNSAAKTKLALVRDLVGAAGNTRPPKPSAKTEVARVEPPRIEASKAPPPAPAAKPESKPAPDAKPQTKVAAAGADEDILKTVRDWAQAWAGKDVKRYLAFYAKDFRAPNGNRAQWEKERAQRILAPKQIEVSIHSPKVMQSGDNAATVTFRQAYRSDRIKANSNKTLIMVRTNGRWLIQQERVGS